MLGQHRGAQPEEFVQVSLVSEPDIDVHAVLRGLGFGDLLEEEDQRTVWGVDGYHRIRSWCQAQCGEPDDLGIVVRPDPPAECGLPELCELRGMTTVQHDPHKTTHPANATGGARAPRPGQLQAARTRQCRQRVELFVAMRSNRAGPSCAWTPVPLALACRGTWRETCDASNRVTGGVDAGMTAGRPMPTQDVFGYFNTLSNWGRWGDDDELGTLNHITDDVRLAAARAVRHGRSVSCAWDVAVPEEMERSTTTCPCAADMPGAENMPVPGFRNDRRWGVSNDRLGIMFHRNPS